MIIILILLFFSNFIFSDHSIPSCSPKNFFCVSIYGPEEINLKDGFPSYYVSIENISGRDFKDGQVRLQIIPLDIGHMFLLKIIKFQRWLYYGPDGEDIRYYSDDIFCKYWKYREVRYFELVPYGFFDFNSTEWQYLERFVYICLRIIHPYGREDFLYLVKINSILPKSINGIELDVEGPLFLTEGESAIFKVKIKNNSPKPFLGNENSSSALVLGFGSVLKNYPDGNEVPDFESFEIIEKNLPFDYYNQDVITRPYGYFKQIVFPIKDFMPGQEYFLKIKIKYRSFDGLINQIPIRNSPFVAFFLSSKKIIDDNTHDAIEFSAGKVVSILYPSSSSEILILNKK